MKKQLVWLIPCFIIAGIIFGGWFLSNLICKIVITPDTEAFYASYLEFMILVGINFPVGFMALLLAGVFASKIDNAEDEKEEEEDEEFQSVCRRRASAHRGRRVSGNRSQRAV